MSRKHKSLHESAAEILAASVTNAGREPLPMSAMMMDPSADLGGATTMVDPSAHGAAASKNMVMSPKAGKAGLPAEEMQLAPDQAEKIVDEDEALDKDSPADTGKMKIKFSEELEGEALVESLIAEHGAEMVLEGFISEYGEVAVFNDIMEEYVNEYGEDLVDEKFGETLFEQYGEENVVAFIAENVIAEFSEQEFTDEEFGALQEQSGAFITEMQTLSDEDFDNYISNLNEEELVHAIQLSSLNEEYLVEFLKKIGKALKKGVKKVGKFAKKVISHPLFSTIASFALPGIGTALGAVGSKLASTALGKAVGAVGSKIASSALGKGVAALGKTVVGGALKRAAGGAIKGGVSSVLQGGKFKEGAKLGAITGVASPLVNKVAGGLRNLTGSEAIGTTAADALAGGIASKATGGKFSQGAKTGAISSLVGRATGNIRKGFGDNAGNVADAVGDAIANRSSGGAAADYEPVETTDVSDSDQTDDRTTVASSTPKNQSQPADDNDYDNLGSSAWKNVAKQAAAAKRRAAGNRPVRQVAEDSNEILQHLSTLNESELNAFVDQLSEEEASFIAEVLEENALAVEAMAPAPNRRNIRGVQDRIDAGNRRGRRNIRGAQDRIDAGNRRDAENASLRAETERLEKLSASTNPPATTPKYGEKGTGANKGKFWTGKAYQKPSEMSDEDRYGKTGAAIRKAGAKAAIAAGQDPKLGADTAYNMRDKTKEGNLKLAADFKKSLADGAFNPEKNKGADAAPADAAPARSGSRPMTDAEIQKLKRDAAGASAAASDAPAASDSGMTEYDYADTWEKNPIPRANAGEREDYEEAPEKTGVGIFRTPTGEKTKLRKAIPNEIANIVGGISGGIGQTFKIKELGYKKQRIDNRQFEDSNMNEENGEETMMETTELTEEQIREERLLAIKEAVKQFKGNMKEDVDALFNGESLSEEFRGKATLIFESAVTSRVESILEQVMQENDEVLATAYDEIKDQITEQVDEYLNYVVEQWMDSNKVAIETGLRAELAEDFISGLRSLFQEHYIEIPEEKVDVAETLATELEQAGEYVQSVHAHVEEQEAVIADLQEQLDAVKKEKSIDNFCEGLTSVQAAKMKALAEGVEFTAEGDFEEKLAVLRENYFSSKVQVKSEVKEIQQAMLNEEPEVVQTNNIMARYVKSISKTAPKA